MENTNGHELLSNDSDEDFDFTARKKHGKQALRIDETDSEEENCTPLAADPVTIHETVDGSNSDENSNESKESSDDDDKISLSTQRKKKRRKKKSDEHEDNDEHKTKISALCDAESSSDESDRPPVETVNDTKKERAPQRMSAKQAEEQMKLIQSESQRMARECHMSVPYHKPKQHSLKDFLNRRTINRPVPMALTKKAAATIKMSKEELEQYAKSLEERNKESQEFYRSDSDDSNKDDNQPDSKTDEQQRLQPEMTDTLPTSTESTEAMDAVQESTESTSNAAEVAHVSVEANEALNEIKTVDDVVESTNIVADVCNGETEIVNVPSGESAESTTEIVITAATIDIETEKPKTVTKESIEIDYSFGENERSEVKTLKELLPIYSRAKPCLKGPVNGVINLDVDDVRPTKSGGDELLERFMKHVAVKQNRSAKEVSILSTDNGVIELNNIKIESDDQNCIHSKPRKDAFKLKQELSARIAAKRKEELLRKQMSTIEIPMENSDSDEDLSTGKGKEIEDSADASAGDKKENFESEVEGLEIGDNGENDDDDGADDEEAIELNDGHESVDEDNEFDEDEVVQDEDGEGDDDQDESELEGCELVPKSKQRKRIILMDNSDDDDNEMSSEERRAENSIKTVDLNTTSVSLDDSYIADEPIDKTMSQICKNQSRADQLIESCSKIVPEASQPGNNMSTLFTQHEDSASVADLLDLCSGSFATQATNVNFVEPEIDSTYQTQVDNFSENEFSDDEIGLPKKLKQRKKVNISDDEDHVDEEVGNTLQNDEASNTSSNDRGQSDADDDGNLSEEEEDEEAVERIVEYDSEENEIEVPLNQKKKIADFFENEAELSESEWGSADEDEQNLDKFEMELGDEDEFDQTQLVSELDRIHRRRMLDQDAREVKIIKDTHFEDEEESGVGRQRQYKWKHMENSLNMDENRTADDGNENAKSDDETEESWRRMRHERNNILQETKNQNETVNETKLTVATTKTKKRISIVKTAVNLNTSATKDLSFLISRMKEEQMNRSSLLIRDEQTLANLAKMTTDDDGIPSVNTNSKNFLFNAISTEKDGKPIGKRKLDDDGAEGESKNRKTVKKIKKSTLSVLDKLM